MAGDVLHRIVIPVSVGNEDCIRLHRFNRIPAGTVIGICYDPESAFRFNQEFCVMNLPDNHIILLR